MASVRVSGVTQVRSRYDHSLHETLAYPAEGFEAFGEIVRGDEVLQVCAELLVIVVVVSLHGGFFDGPIHAFDLPVGPGMIGFGEAVIDAVQKTDSVKRVTAEARRGSLAVLGQVGELDAVIGEHYVNSIGMAVIRAWRNAAAARMSARSTSSTKANFEVRSMATNRYSLPSAVRTSARSM